jgi:hypothetical protein
VVLGRNFNFSGGQVHDRMIAAMVSEFELIRLSTQCEANDLVPKTNPKDRDFANQGSHVLFGVRHSIGVSWAI